MTKESSLLFTTCCSLSCIDEMRKKREGMRMGE